MFGFTFIFFIAVLVRFKLVKVNLRLDYRVVVRGVGLAGGG